jgi:hypothetical protein
MTHSAEHGGIVDFNVEAWDFWSGVVSVMVNLADPAGLTMPAVSLHESEELHWSGSLDIPEDAPVGVYTVESVELVDAAGNLTIVDQEALVEEGWSDEFSVYEGFDTEPPTLSNFNISPLATSTAAGPVDVNLEGWVADGQSGVRLMEVHVALPNAAFSWLSSVVPFSHLRSGNQEDGLQVATLALPQFAYPGDYRVTEIAVQDWAGNRQEWEGAELEALGVPLDIEALAPGDTARPQVASASLSPPVIPASGGTVETLIHMQDDFSGLGEFPNEGLSELDIGFAWPGSPSQTETTGEVPRRISGTPVDGIWRIVTNFNASAPAGKYSIRFIDVADRAGNWSRILAPELEAMGLQLGFTKLP